jgi:hypothetical protein
MNDIKPQAAPARLAVAVLLSQLLQRLDHSAESVGAEQYRSVVRHLVEELEQLNGDAALPRLLDSFPSVAELYENLHWSRRWAPKSRRARSSAAPCAAPPIQNPVTVAEGATPARWRSQIRARRRCFAARPMGAVDRGLRLADLALGISGRVVLPEAMPPAALSAL